jgi:hypothetical protein
LKQEYQIVPRAAVSFPPPVCLWQPLLRAVAQNKRNTEPLYFGMIKILVIRVPLSKPLKISRFFLLAAKAQSPKDN